MDLSIRRHYWTDKCRGDSWSLEKARPLCDEGQLGSKFHTPPAVTSVGCICRRASGTVSRSPHSTSASVSRLVSQPLLTSFTSGPHTHTSTSSSSSLSAPGMSDGRRDIACQSLRLSAKVRDHMGHYVVLFGEYVFQRAACFVLLDVSATEGGKKNRRGGETKKGEKKKKKAG